MKQTNTPAAKISAIVGPKITADISAAIEERNKINKWLAEGKAREMELRKMLVAFFCPSPREGTNNIEGAGYAVKVGHTVSRKLDEAALDSVMPQLPEELRVVGQPNSLISYKPKFSMDVYRAMSDEHRKIFDQALTIKEDGAPELEIILGNIAAQEAPAAPATAKRTRKPRAEKPAATKSTKPAVKPATGKKRMK